MIRTVFFLIALIACAPVAHAEIAGRASVVDGDTLEVHGTRIRLYGIDAPESAQLCQAKGKSWRCGQQAALALDGKIAGRPVSCSERDRDRYGRTVAVCAIGGEQLNGWAVAEGWALAYRQYARDYIDQEQVARRAEKGIWRGAFVPPWDWRRGIRLAEAAAPAERAAAPIGQAKGEGACRIKGNISAKGERIYHVPGGAFYSRTQISAAKGERWFCSEEEARQVGWRRSRR